MAENDVLKNAKGETDAEKYKVDNALEGAGAVQDVFGGAEKLLNGDWTEGLLSLAGAVPDIVEVIKNPLETLMSWGFGWIIEHVDFLKEPLDWVSGDQDALDLEVQKWLEVGKYVKTTAETLTDEVQKNCMEWSGAAADAYRAYVQKQLNGYREIVRLAELAGNIINICKTVLSVVRTIIRDLITDALAKIVMIIARYPPPAYPAALAAEGVPFAIEKSTEAMTWAEKLMRVLMRAKSMLMDFYKNVGDLLKKGDVFEGAGMGAFWEVVKEAGKTAVKEVVKSASEDKARDRRETTINAAGEPKPPEKANGAVGSRQPVEQQPIFEQPGTQRISGSIQ
ncbi:hypothetical protein [Amycolatopsis sp. BJA-103]|uniref:hypothetical protein n=1 Tax=Amycolatopsis sp. BJA-103 TaxID=1911175 RepID=UPI000C779922|nr:hypothetical protein [Amycolatopsis sp. BJA-103]AUI62638.1 hypothetical protein BKN51_33780 [Amycolatopsis sp. BJA-103]PNE18476.1 hypothetical protein B1H26_11465 [Amycolatopsis sp. BJA-103]